MVPNRPTGLQSFGTRHRRPVQGMSTEGIVCPGQKSPGLGPSTDDCSLNQGQIYYILLGNESSGTPYHGTNLQPRRTCTESGILSVIKSDINF
jgi:hypothetical protein